MGSVKSFAIQTGGSVVICDCFYNSLPICVYVNTINSIWVLRSRFLNTFNNTAFTALSVLGETIIKSSCFSNCSIINTFQSIDGCTLRIESTSTVSVSENSFFGCFACRM